MKMNDVIAISQWLQAHELYAFQSRTLGDLLDLDQAQTSRLLKRMTSSGLAARLEAGRYLLLGLSPEHALSNPLYIGCNLVIPSYISFWSALHYHGFTEQTPQTTCVATTRRKASIVFQGYRFQFITLRHAAFFGYRSDRQAELPIVIADEQKSILDSLLFSAYSGGMAEAARALRSALDRLDITILVEYANRLNSPNLGSRLGYLLELFERPVEGLRLARGPVGLDPQAPKQGKFHRRWNIYANIPLPDLLAPGVL
jgi:predicted transcriptional regulator of viral defense system